MDFFHYYYYRFLRELDFIETFFLGHEYLTFVQYFPKHTVIYVTLYQLGIDKIEGMSPNKSSIEVFACIQMQNIILPFTLLRQEVA